MQIISTPILIITWTNKRTVRIHARNSCCTVASPTLASATSLSRTSKSTTGMAQGNEEISRQLIQSYTSNILQRTNRRWSRPNRARWWAVRSRGFRCHRTAWRTTWWPRNTRSSSSFFFSSISSRTTTYPRTSRTITPRLSSKTGRSFNIIWSLVRLMS